MSETIKVLLIEDDPGDVFLIEEKLSLSPRGVRLERVERLMEGLERINKGGIDLVLLDLNLPDSAGMETLSRMADNAPEIPIIILTGHSHEAFGREAVKRGAQDFLLKGEIEPKLLMRAIHYAIERKKVEIELKAGESRLQTHMEMLKQANELLARQATTDALTGIHNRLSFNELLSEEAKRARRYGTRLSLIMFDLDHFKNINDTYGHNAGDNVLRQAAAFLSEHIREQDIFARWGGEEFMVLAANTDLEQAAILAEKLRGLVETRDFGENLRVTASFGVTNFSGDDSDDSFTARADKALFAAKRKGRNRVVVI